MSFPESLIPEVKLPKKESDQEEIITVGKDGKLKISDPLIIPIVSNPQDVRIIHFASNKTPRTSLLEKIGKIFPNCRRIYVSKSMWDKINKNHEIRDILEKYKIAPIVPRK